jgi:hypothetical protein
METNNNTSFSSLVLHNELNNSHYEVTKQAQIENMKRKAYCDISRTQQWKNKKMLATYLEKSSTFLNSIGLEFDQIILTNKNRETNHHDINNNISFKRENNMDSNYIKKVLFKKDKHNLSDKAYNALHCELNLNVPTLYAINPNENYLKKYMR